MRAYTANRDQQLGLKLIIGSEITFQGEKLVLLCPDRAAYGELSRLITQARMRSEKGTIRYSEMISAISPVAFASGCRHSHKVINR